MCALHACSPCKLVPGRILAPLLLCAPASISSLITTTSVGTPRFKLHSPALPCTPLHSPALLCTLLRTPLHSPPASHLVHPTPPGTMQVVAPQHALAADYLHEEWDPQHIAQLMDCLRAAPAPGESSAAGAGECSYRLDLLTRDFDKVGSAEAMPMVVQAGAPSLPRCVSCTFPAYRQRHLQITKPYLCCLQLSATPRCIPNVQPMDMRKTPYSPTCPSTLRSHPPFPLHVAPRLSPRCWPLAAAAPRRTRSRGSACSGWGCRCVNGRPGRTCKTVLAQPDRVFLGPSLPRLPLVLSHPHFLSHRVLSPAAA